MKLPHIIKNENDAHFVLLILAAVNSLLLIVLFFAISPFGKKQLLPRLSPISSQTPIVRFNLVSPSPNSTVFGTVPLVTTLSNGPKIIGAQLYVDSEKVQAVTSQKTSTLTLYWDTTKHTEGTHKLEIKVTDEKKRLSSLATSLNIQNNVSRTVSSR